jgi:methionyl-tRNA synthetase
MKGEDQRERLATVLHVAAQCVSDCNTCSRRSCRTRQCKVHAVLGGAGEFMPMPTVTDVTDLDNGSAYPIITGDYSATPTWARRPVVAGTPIGKPAPAFVKLDESVVAEELARMAN